MYQDAFLLVQMTSSKSEKVKSFACVDMTSRSVHRLYSQGGDVTKVACRCHAVYGVIDVYCSNWIEQCTKFQNAIELIVKRLSGQLAIGGVARIAEAVGRVH